MITLELPWPTLTFFTLGINAENHDVPVRTVGPMMESRINAKQFKSMCNKDPPFRVLYTDCHEKSKMSTFFLVCSLPCLLFFNIPVSCNCEHGNGTEGLNTERVQRTFVQCRLTYCESGHTRRLLNIYE